MCSFNFSGKKMKNNYGFTLVEVIVVAVIMAVLAAVAIPMYNSYVKSAKTDAARTTCELMAAAMIHQHNKGLTIRDNMTPTSQLFLDDLGMTDPSDKDWTYTYHGWPSTTSQSGLDASDISHVHAISKKGLGGYRMYFNKTDLNDPTNINSRWYKYM